MLLCRWVIYVDYLGFIFWPRADVEQISELYWEISECLTFDGVSEEKLDVKFSQFNGPIGQSSQ